MLSEQLFRWRGVLLGALGLAVAWFARPDGASLLRGAPLLLAGLGLRAWAFRHLGPAGRTRDPRGPGGRVTEGPYRWISHPVYCANLLLVAGLLVTAALPVPAAAPVLAAVFAFYVALGRREARQLRSAPRRPSAGLAGAGIARSERSTWLSIALLLAAQGLAAVASR